MNTAEIKAIIEDFLKAATFTFETIEIIEKDGIGPVFMIKSSDSKILIGKEGETLRHINLLVKKLVAQKLKMEKDPIFSVDVNNYREITLTRLEHKARLLADRAVSFKTIVELEPMSSYERMYIHSLFANNPHIKTESVGTGKDRHLTLRYVDVNNEGFI